jgi:hypothetical protein
VDNCNQLFTAFSEFRRLTIRFKNGENQPDEKVPDLSKILKEHGISRNYVGFVKKELVERKLVNAKFTKWNDLMSKPTYEMAESVASSASKALSSYQKEMEKKRKAAKKAEQEAPKEEPKKPDLLEGVEISPNPQRMEDDVLDGPQSFIEHSYLIEGPSRILLRARRDISQEQYNELISLELRNYKEPIFIAEKNIVKCIHIVCVDGIME